MSDNMIAPLPHVAIQFFTESAQVSDMAETVTQDRRMSKVHLRIQTGGVAAAVEAYRHAPTPNVIVIETTTNREQLLMYLDELAGFCDEGTRVVVIGHVNDVPLYRELMRRGVSEYLVAPIQPLAFIQSLSEIFHDPNTKLVGKVIAFIGTKGGVGSSIISHNIAYTISKYMELETAILDFDLPFGTAGLDFNQDPTQGILDAAQDSARLDINMLDRLLARCGSRLNLMSSPANLDRTYDFPAETFDPLLDSIRSSMPIIICDIPHNWNGWIRSVLMHADEVVLVSNPDLANLRNTKNLLDTISTARVNDKSPYVILNQVGIPKKPEISQNEFAKSLGINLLPIIPFDPNLFGTAVNNGQMIGELQPNSKIQESFTEIAKIITGKKEMPKIASDSVIERITNSLLARFNK